MRRVILESPYAPRNGHTIEDHITYARRCVRDSILRGEAPIASHLLFTQPNILDDNVPHERALGIAAGLAWLPVADCSIFYTDFGWSTGMLAALDVCRRHSLNRNLIYEIRAFDNPPQEPPL